jgi:signal transduction histidine kinase
VEHGSSDLTVRVGELDRGGFYVEDDGVGIPEDEREEVFGSGYSTGEDGTGFGLAIVTEIVDAHGWRIRVRESREGGARFEIEL